MPAATIELSGHIIDSFMLPRIFDAIMDYGGTFHVEEFRVGQSKDETSYTRIELRHDDAAQLHSIVAACLQQGAVLLATPPARTEPAPRDGVFPDAFYSTSNQPTSVLGGAGWIEVEAIEMDCAIVLNGGRARCVAVTDVRAGDAVVCGHEGIRVAPVERSRAREIFGFMTSSVSSEKPKHLVIRELAAAIRDVHARGGRICMVAGPAIIHTGAGEHLSRLIASGHIDVLLAGNALAAHDVEAQLFGTSLGIDLRNGLPIEAGHEHHIRAINRIRAAGGLQAAVESGLLRAGDVRSRARRHRGGARRLGP